ncbi:MAG TPA: thiamine pyrophosphate-binding protein [Burkholderiales bacterium]
MTSNPPSTVAASISGAQAVVRQFAARGVKHMYGVPGGDCSIDLIAAAEEVGIKFVLTRSESAAAMMAAAAAQVNGSLGVVLTTRGPGLANGLNGVACALLDRVGLVFISDGYENEQAFVSHQRFDQPRVMEGLVKGQLRIDAPTALPALGPLLDLAQSRPHGPVYLEVTGQGMRGKLPLLSLPEPRVPQAPLPALQQTAVAAARELMKGARRPVILAGLQTREPGAAAALRKLAAQWHCPVFTTYMGKGSIADTDALCMGHFMAGGAEDETMKSADLILSYGMDPIELLPKPWKYTAPVVEVATCAFDRNHYSPAVLLLGDLAEAAGGLGEGLARSTWQDDALKALKAHMRERATFDAGSGPITPTFLSRTACELLPKNARVTVDAGAHMLPLVAFYDAANPYDLLVTRGLATMAYGLPSGIGAAMADPARPVVTFTGDGGLMMCAGELATAAQVGANLTVVVFNDSSVAMIGVKQNSRGFARVGMDYSTSNFAKVAEGFGCKGIEVKERGQLAAALREAYAHNGPVVVDVTIAHDSYQQQLKSLRG